MQAALRIFALALSATLLAACSDDYSDAPTTPNPTPAPTATVITGSGDITAKVVEFRTLLGDPNNGGTAGQQAAGRREIGWDGAAANPFNNKNDFPSNFFNTTARNGAVFTTNGTGFRNDSLLFAEVNPSYATQFSFFSANRIFSPVGSNQMDVLFQVAGSPTPALVAGFGVVFVDVDAANSARIELFSADSKSLGVFAAPVRSDAGGLSFVGAKFASAIVARVRITLGTGALGAGVNDVTNGGTLDLVVVDNFLYGEPKAAF